MNHYTQSLSEEILYKVDELKIKKKEEDELTSFTFREFYNIVDNLKKAYPAYRPQDFKCFMKTDEFKEEYDDIIYAFLDDFGYPDMSNDYFKDVVIALSTIGVEIPQKPRVKNNSVNDEDENNNNVYNINELLPEERVHLEEVSEIKQEVQEV
jgi:hypothetical protein